MSKNAGAHTLPMQKLMNRVVRSLLRVPGLNRIVGGRLVTIEVVGRKTGRRFEVPVAYTRDGADLLIGSPFPWGRNLRSGEPVMILLKGARRSADVTVYTERDDVLSLYAQICRDNSQFAGFNGVRVDGGVPNADDLETAWKLGARVFRLTPR